MKISKLSIIAVLFTISMFTISPAHATASVVTKTPAKGSSFFGGIIKGFTDLIAPYIGTGSTAYPIPSAGSSPGGTSLPIDNNVVILVIAAGAIGCKVIMNKKKVLATQTIKK